MAVVYFKVALNFPCKHILVCSFFLLPRLLYDMNNYTVLRRYCDIIITHASRAKYTAQHFSLSSTRIPLDHHEICFKAFNIFPSPTRLSIPPNCRKTLFREMIPRFRFFSCSWVKRFVFLWVEVGGECFESMSFSFIQWNLFDLFY